MFREILYLLHVLDDDLISLLTELSHYFFLVGYALPATRYGSNGI